MFTNNMNTFMLMTAFGGGRTFTSGAGEDVKTTFTLTEEGFLEYMDTARSGAMITSEASGLTNAKAGVHFGSGSTPASKTDYCLESYIGSLGIQNGSRIYVNEGDGVHSYHVTFGVTNNNAEEIVIREIGLSVPVITSKTSSSTKCYPVLLERTVLDEPIPIAPGETKLVTYKITFNHR